MAPGIYPRAFAPSLLQKASRRLARELEKWWKEGVTAQELSARKQGIIGDYLVGLSTTGGLADAILTTCSAAMMWGGWMSQSGGECRDAGPG